MISRRVQENAILVFLILALIGVIVTSLDFGPRARMVPIPVAAFGLVLAVIQLVWQNMRSADELQVDLLEVLTKRKSVSVPGAEKKIAVAAAESDQAKWRREVTAYGMVLLFLAMTWAIGPLVPVDLSDECNHRGVSGADGAQPDRRGVAARQGGEVAR